MEDADVDRRGYAEIGDGSLRPEQQAEGQADLRLHAVGSLDDFRGRVRVDDVDIAGGRVGRVPPRLLGLALEAAVVDDLDALRPRKQVDEGEEFLLPVQQD